MSAETPNAKVAAASSPQSSDVEEPLRFERLISDLSVSIVNAPAESLDETIEMALGRLGRHLRLGLATVLCLDPSRNVFKHTHEWYEKELLDGPSFRGTEIGEPHLWVAESLAQGKDVLVSRLEEFPPEAIGERETCEALGIRSVLWVPFWTREQVAGYVAYNSIGRETEWTDRTVQRLRLVGQIFGAALDRRRQAGELEARLEFEHFISELSASLVESAPEELDATVQQALQRLARIVGLERASLGQVRGELVVVTHSWVDESLPASQQVIMRELPVENLWILQQALEGHTTAISSRDELPEGAHLEQRVWDERGLKSTIFVPGRIGNKILGAVAMDSLSKARRWSEDTIRRLALPVELLFTALARAESERARRRDQTELKAAYEEISQLKSRLEDENVYLRNEIRQRTGPSQIIGDSAAIKKMLEAAAQVAATDSTVLISGETGTGKELLARAIHTMSDRRDRTLVRISCGSLPPTLIESELFGREKGAYTGALTQQKGRFEIAHGSTILLDEIGELPMELQAKLLEVLETGSFERLGSTRTVTVDVRVIAATNRDLEKCVKEGRFREDLFFRLNVFPVHIAPLRERPGDIPLLVWSFVREFSRTMGKPIESIPEKHMARLQRYAWPGNVRELRNAIERAMIRSKSPVLEIDIPGGSPRSGAASLEELERNHIRKILKATGWRVRGSGGAAEILGLKPTTLDYRMKKLGIRRPSKNSSIS